MKTRYFIFSAILLIALYNAIPQAPLISITSRVEAGKRFSPQTIAGLEIWYDANIGVKTGAGRNARDGDAVATWEDQSGNNNDGFVNDCVFVASTNGSPALQTGGTSLSNVLSSASISDATVTAFYVLETVDTSWVTSSEGDQSAQNTFVGVGASGSGASSDGDAGTVVYYTNNVVVSPDTRDDVYDAVATGLLTVFTFEADYSLWGENVLNVLGYDGSSGFEYDGLIREYLLYNTTLSDDNRNLVVDYLQDKYSPRRGSFDPETPTHIAGLQGWYRPSGLSGTPVGSVATNWTDSSGNGYTISDPFPASGVTREANILNGYDGILHAGTEGLETNLGVTNSQPNTFFLVVRPTITNATKLYVDGYSSLENQIGIIQGGLYMHGGSLLWKTDELDTNEFFIITAVFNGASSSLRTNGVEGLSGNAGSDPHVGHTFFGGPSSAQGYGVENFWYDGLLRDDQIDTIENYLSKKYGITLAP